MVKGTLQHLLRQLRLGRKEALRGNACTLAARCVVGPFLGEIELTIEHDMALGTRIGQKHSNLAIFNAPCCPAILACHPRRMPAFFEKSCLIDDQHGLGSPQMLDHIRAQIVPERIGIPLCPS
jgi:hypothetical protein